MPPVDEDMGIEGVAEEEGESTGGAFRRVHPLCQLAIASAVIQSKGRRTRRCKSIGLSAQGYFSKVSQHYNEDFYFPNFRGLRLLLHSVLDILPQWENQSIPHSSRGYF
jgi:hypothetical protein